MADWMLDELAHAGAEHLDPGYVAGYDAKAGYDPASDVEVLLGFGLDERATLLDMGAGTGVFTLAIAPYCARVVAVDVAPPMVAALSARVVAAGLDNIDVVHAGYLSYVHSGQPPTFAFSRNALHQVPDFWKGIALSRLAAVLAPGAVLRLRDLVFDFEPADAPARVQEWFAGAVDDPARGWTAEELAEHVRLEHSTYRWLFEPLLDHAGFDVLDCAYVRSAYGAYTCRRR